MVSRREEAIRKFGEVAMPIEKDYEIVVNKLSNDLET